MAFLRSAGFGRKSPSGNFGFLTYDYLPSLSLQAKCLFYGIQYHIEVKESTVQEWGAVPEYKQALVDTLGEKALPELDRLAKDCMGDMNANCKKLYENFKCLIAK